MSFLNALNSGKKPPEDINVVIEIPKGSNIKYELDPANGILYVDRILSVEMIYPFNYGLIPKTLENSDKLTTYKDNLDVFVIGIDSLQPRSVVNCVPIGVILTEDQDGLDSKIIARPSSKTDELNNELLNDLRDINSHILNKLIHFIEHHKDLEKNKFVKIKQIAHKERAKIIILDGIKNYEKYIKSL
jgi:inorganic pyrophosphatase